MLGSEIKDVYNTSMKVNNRQARYDGFATSFMPRNDDSWGPESEDGETALIYDGKYLILNGDWMLTYAELAPQGLQACIDFFKSKADMFKSSWSNEP